MPTTPAWKRRFTATELGFPAWADARSRASSPWSPTAAAPLRLDPRSRGRRRRQVDRGRRHRGGRTSLPDGRRLVWWLDPQATNAASGW